MDPSSRPIAVVGGLFFGGGAVVLLLARYAAPGTQKFNRAMGAASTVIGVGCALGAYQALTDPVAVETTRFPAELVLVVCVLGALFFGLGGLYLLITAPGRR